METKKTIYTFTNANGITVDLSAYLDSGKSKAEVARIAAERQRYCDLVRSVNAMMYAGEMPEVAGLLANYGFVRKN